MVTFMYQPDWITECPDTLLNVVSGCVCESLSGLAFAVVD